MKHPVFLFCLWFSLISEIPSSSIAQKIAGASSREELLFDAGWKFHRGGAQGVEEYFFDDRPWRTVDLPHDWSIEDLPGTRSPFQPDAIGQVSTGFTEGGTGWYRKAFTIRSELKGKRFYLLFEGVYMNSDIWLNGVHLGNHPYGYTSFGYDISSVIKPDSLNVVAVEVKNEGQNSRWYSGSGIYRHVWLIATQPVHIIPWGVYVTTPEVSPSGAQVKLKTQIKNESASSVRVKLESHILDPDGKEVAVEQSEKNFEPGSDFEFIQEATVTAPQFWSTETPMLYHLVTSVYAEGQPTDRLETRFGIRAITFDPENGFRLNGKTMKLKGGCVHHDNGPLGAKSFDRAEVRKVQLLKASGFNAIRCAHNPPSPAILNACDSLGMLVIDEAFDMWNYPKNSFDYHLYFRDWWNRDIRSMVERDRNHPCVILWSIGNEIPGNDHPIVAELAQRLADTIRVLDPTRLVTAAVNDVSDKKDPYISALDVAGYNYARQQYASDHQRKPGRVMFGSESFALDAFDYWTDVDKYSWVTGDFIWTSFDYIGEASIGWRGYMQKNDFYPWNLAFCGDLDICGWKRPQSFYRDALWKNGNNVSIFVIPPKPSFPVNAEKENWSRWNWHDVVADWNWNGYEKQPMGVEVYSDCEHVELFLNGKSLGKKSTDFSARYTAHWEVPYQPGVLKAVGYMGSKTASECELKTAGTAVRIRLGADRQQLKADGEDLVYITVDLTDQNGIRNPKAENLVHFTVNGPGTLIAVGNANPVSLESYIQPQRKAWQGRCLAIIRSGNTPGMITVKAESDGLESSEISIRSGD